MVCDVVHRVRLSDSSQRAAKISRWPGGSNNLSESQYGRAFPAYWLLLLVTQR